MFFKKKKNFDFIKLLASLIICQLAGAVGSVFTSPKIKTWYAGLIKPNFNPPNWIFGPVWTILFLLMGVALFLIWRQTKAKNKTALTLFGIQLGLNIFWSVLFFGLQSPQNAFIEIILLWLIILLTIISFYKISKTASILLIPYIAWVSFAAVLNFYLWRLNI